MHTHAHTRKVGGVALRAGGANALPVLGQGEEGQRDGAFRPALPLVEALGDVRGDDAGDGGFHGRRSLVDVHGETRVCEVD